MEDPLIPFNNTSKNYEKRLQQKISTTVIITTSETKVSHTAFTSSSDPELKVKLLSCLSPLS